MFPDGGRWSGGEVELGASGLDCLVEGVDEFAHGDVGEVAAFAVAPFLVLLLEDGADEARLLVDKTGALASPVFANWVKGYELGLRTHT